MACLPAVLIRAITVMPASDSCLFRLTISSSLSTRSRSTSLPPILAFRRLAVGSCSIRSAYTASRYPQVLVEYMKGHGRHKVLFGTNYPMITPAKALEGVDALGLDEQARQLFLGGNATRVFAATL